MKQIIVDALVKALIQLFDQFLWDTQIGYMEEFQRIQLEEKLRTFFG